MSTRPTCALVLLCVVQGCERFAFFAMLPLFVLYLHQRHGFSEPSSLLVLGVFQSLSFCGGQPAGAAIDSKLGPTAALILGGALLTLGYAGLATDHRALLWPALALIVVGHSFFRPGMGTLLSRSSTTGDERIERAFLWQYLAINVAGILGPLAGESAQTTGGWGRLFLYSAAAMFVDTFVLSVGAGLLPAEARRAASEGDAVADSGDSRERWNAVWLLCCLAAVFWLTTQQAASSLVLFAESHTERSVAVFGRSLPIGPAQFASLHSLLVLVLLLGSAIGFGRLRRSRAAPSLPSRMVWGYVATAAAFALRAL